MACCRECTCRPWISIPGNSPNEGSFIRVDSEKDGQFSITSNSFIGISSLKITTEGADNLAQWLIKEVNRGLDR